MVENERSKILDEDYKVYETMNELNNSLVENNNPPATNLHGSSESNLSTEEKEGGFLSRFVGKSSRWRRKSSNHSLETFTGSSYSNNYEDSDEQSNYAALNDSQDISGGYDDDDDNDNDDEPEEIPFAEFFYKSKGPPQIVLLSMLFALSLGSTIGVVPAVLTERFAVEYHGFDGECSDYDSHDKPQACLDGSSDAQTASAASSFVSNFITFLTSSLVGSLSDEYGRRNVMILGQFLTCLAPLTLVMLQIFNDMKPTWYYVAGSTTGLVSWLSVALSSMSDVMPPHWRAPTFGLLMSGFSLGFALSPFIAVFMSHLGVSILSFTILFLSFLLGIFFLPETLPPEKAAEARLLRSEYRLGQNESKISCISRSLLRPFKELSILNRNNLFRLLSVLAFFSGMSTSADQNLLIYYAEDRLDFNDGDVAVLFGIIGIVGIFVQSVMLKLFTDLVGERFTIVIAFICGMITNTIYAFADRKEHIFIAAVVSSFTGMSFPTISAIKANNAEGSEQGRIQGALYALSSLASAVGPAALRYGYHKTRDAKYPGSFFLVATGFFTVAVVCACALPKDKANTSRTRNGDYDEVALVEARSAEES